MNRNLLIAMGVGAGTGVLVVLAALPLVRYVLPGQTPASKPAISSGTPARAPAGNQPAKKATTPKEAAARAVSALNNGDLDTLLADRIAAVKDDGDEITDERKSVLDKVTRENYAKLYGSKDLQLGEGYWYFLLGPNADGSYNSAYYATSRPGTFVTVSRLSTDEWVSLGVATDVFDMTHFAVMTDETASVPATAKATPAQPAAGKPSAPAKPPSQANTPDGAAERGVAAINRRDAAPLAAEIVAAVDNGGPISNGSSPAEARRSVNSHVQSEFAQLGDSPALELRESYWWPGTQGADGSYEAAIYLTNRTDTVLYVVRLKSGKWVFRDLSSGSRLPAGLVPMTASRPAIPESPTNNPRAAAERAVTALNARDAEPLAADLTVAVNGGYHFANVDVDRPSADKWVRNQFLDLDQRRVKLQLRDGYWWRGSQVAHQVAIYRTNQEGIYVRAARLSSGRWVFADLDFYLYWDSSAEHAP